MIAVIRLGLADRRAAGAFVCALGLLAGAGCSGRDSGKVTGKVTHSGHPVSGGMVNFTMKEKGIAAAAKIDTSGSFALDTPLEAGTYTVYVTPPPPEPSGPGGSAPKAGANAEIPRKYRDPATSTLTCTVKSGSNEVPIELTD